VDSIPAAAELELSRVRELTRTQRHREALTAAQSLAFQKRQGVLTSGEHPDVIYLIAANQRCLGQIREALETLERLEQQHPGFSRLYQERGYCYVALRDPPRAIEAFRQGTAIDPALSTSWDMLERLYRVTGARAEHARLLIERQRHQPARQAIETLLKLEPRNPEYLSLYAITLAALGEAERAISLYRELLQAPVQLAEWRLLLGHALKSTGQQIEAITQYRAACVARPSFGDAYWSLANLKTYRFTTDEIAQMRHAEAAADTSPTDRYHLCFALGKALEDAADYAQSWRYYDRGNALKREQSHYQPERGETNTREQMDVLKAEFFAARSGAGAANPDPIFIVGLPRSGSTLIEQILSSHPQVEGTQELPDIPRMATDLPPRVLRELAVGEFRKLGERYLADTRVYRKRADRLFFIDKMPNNFRHVGLIHLILPNARIIDVRREPMACCFSNLKQLFAAGQEFTYDIEHVARYYRAYLDLMRHWDNVLPGRVLRVSYEDVVQDLETNVQRLLDFCGLPFDPACLEFHRTGRSVRTASSEQVRQPIFRDGIDQWRNYEPWIGSLRDALGDALTRYRE
jgi:tetratricopeptide (TPR) repeat protein